MSPLFVSPKRHLLLLMALLAAPLSAEAFRLDADPANSSITREGEAPVPITGQVFVEIGAAAPSGNSPLAISGLDVSSGALDIGLQPIASPGLGVLGSSGAFLIPTLFLTLDDGSGPVDFALPDITGNLLANGPGCGADNCLETSFEIDTGAGGLVSVALVAIPEPSTALLLGLGCLGLGLCDRRTSR